MLITIFLAVLPSVATASHIPGQPCTGCASHQYWPTIDGLIVKAKGYTGARLLGTNRSDELLGHHGSDTISGRGDSDVLWGDWDGVNQPTRQRDLIFGGGGNDFIYGSHGRNTIYAGYGNDVIRVHYGRGYVDCGPGRDLYHVARSRRDNYTFKNCEKVEYRTESRGGVLRPLS
jgi:Ca2+-binding RTX toxin-like protein